MRSYFSFLASGKYYFAFLFFATGIVGYFVNNGQALNVNDFYHAFSATLALLSLTLFYWKYASEDFGIDLSGLAYWFIGVSYWISIPLLFYGLAMMEGSGVSGFVFIYTFCISMVAAMTFLAVLIESPLGQAQLERDYQALKSSKSHSKKSTDCTGVAVAALALGISL